MQAAQGKMSSSLATVSQLEELIALGYQQPAPPQEFTSTVLFAAGTPLLPVPGHLDPTCSCGWTNSAQLPWLKGRATVEFELKRPGCKFDVEGKLYDELKLTTVVDGYTAPLTAGNFVDLVQRGFYNGCLRARAPLLTAIVHLILLSLSP